MVCYESLEFEVVNKSNVNLYIIIELVAHLRLYFLKPIMHLK
jgi:hypothetical protein